MGGIEVIRVPLYPSHDRSILGRVANYLSFALSASTIGLFLTKKVDVVYVYHPPATIGLPALMFRWLRRTPCVYDIQDLWPDTLEATGMLKNRMALAVVGWWCLLIYRSVDRIVVLSPGFKRRLVERGVPEGRIEVIYNWCDEHMIINQAGSLSAHEARVFEGKFTVLFAGNLGDAQGLGTILDAAALLAQTDTKVQFVLVGSGLAVTHLRERAEAECLGNVIFLPRRPQAEMRSVYQAADVLLVHLRDDPLFAITIPSKTQAYLVCGRPILIGVRGDAAELVRRADAGFACEPGNPASLAAAVRFLSGLSTEERCRLGENGRRFYVAQLSLDKGVAAFERLFEEVLRT
jgi:glycosyltransferase involved in cell wall biosynthesis